jgi:phage recombination protein Bet
MNTQVAVPTKKDGVIEYVPFGAKDPVKLSLAIIKNYVAVKTRSGKTCDDAQAMRFMMLCQAQRLNPFTGDAFLVGYDKREKDGSYTPVFSLITAHQAFIKRAEENKDYEGMESGIILIAPGDGGGIIEREGDFRLPNETVVGGWAKVYRKGRRPTYRRLAIAAMKPAYETPFWSEDKAPGQICKCAESQALRDTFPTLLGGLYLDNELQSAAIDVTTVEPSKLVAIADAPTQEQDQQPPPKPVEKSITEAHEITPQAELEKFVITNGYTFDHFQLWAVNTGNIPDAGSFTDFSMVDAKAGKRFLKAPAGLLAGLLQAKNERGE